MISERIRQRRTELGLKQEELAEILGVSRNTAMQKHSMIFPTLYRLNLLFLNIFLAYQTLA